MQVEKKKSYMNLLNKLSLNINIKISFEFNG